MEAITLSGVIILCIALWYKHDKKVEKKAQEEILQNEQEFTDNKIIEIRQEPAIKINTETDLEGIKKELHEINNTLSFFKGLAEIIIIFIIIKYIFLATIFAETGNAISKFLNTFKY